MRRTLILTITIALVLGLAGTANAVQFIPATPKARALIQSSAMPAPAIQIYVLPLSAMCPGAASCRSAGPAWNIAFSDLDSFYFEMGGLADSCCFTDAQRAHLAALWGRPHARWWNDPNVLATTEDGLEADFAGVYDECAKGHWQNNQGLIVGIAPSILFGRSSCQYIRDTLSRYGLNK